MKRIYLDHAAGSPIRPEARDAMAEAADCFGGNPSSLHAEGREARLVVEAARESVSRLAGCAGEELVFTSGGTEANRLALEGAAKALTNDKIQIAKPALRILASQADHPSVLGCVEDLGLRGFDTSLIPVDGEGRLVLGAAPSPLGRGEGEGAFLSLLWVNNETGVIQDAEKIIGEAKAGGWTVHVDAAQGIGKLDMSALAQADLISFSAAKIGGPGGIGALVVRKGALWNAPWTGGKQEGSRRPGTEAAILAGGFGAAAEASAKSPLTLALSRGEREFLERLREAGAAFKINGPESDGRLPGLINLSFPRWEADQLCAALDLSGVAASPGAACSSGVVRFSHVLRAMGRSETEARGGVRFSFGWNTTRDDAVEAGCRVAGIVGSPKVKKEGIREKAKTKAEA